MIAYHLSWDLSWFGFVDWPVANGPGWEAFAASIAGSFLFLSGVSLVLAHAATIRWRPFWKREAVIVAAAVAVSIATYFAFGDIFVRFGILHAIAVSSLIALPFVRLPALVGFAAAVFVYTLPHWASDPAFDGQLLLWTGLGSPSSGSVDYVPLAPWTAATLLGVAVMKTPIVHARLERLSQFRFSSRLGRFLQVCGRKSLIIYLLHQPILYGLVWSLSAAGLAPDRDVRAFQTNCTEACQMARGPEAPCAEICACTVTALQSDGIWSSLVKDPENPELLGGMNDRYAACISQPNPSEPLTPSR